MRTLRAKLFISTGTIFLFIGITSTLTSEIWIQKDLAKAGFAIKNQIENAQKQMRKFSSFLLSFHIIENATNLSRETQMAANADFSLPWQKALDILSSDPNIAFVEIQESSGKQVTISIEDANSHPFSWAFDSKGKLWARIEGYPSLFSAYTYQKNGKNHYALFKDSSLQDPSSLSFTFIGVKSPSHYWENSPFELFESLTLMQDQWAEKIDLISSFLPKQKDTNIKPFAIASIDTELNKGICLIIDEIFPCQPLVVQPQQNTTEQILYILLRDLPQNQALDIVKTFSLSGEISGSITLGFSLSSLLKEVSSLIKKPIIVTGNGLSIGFSPEGKMFNPLKNQISLDLLSQNALSWQGEKYIVFPIDLNILKVFILTPENEVNIFSNFLENLGEGLVAKISLTLISTALIFFLIALFLLNNISKKITNPIAMLSHAAKTLGKGNYTGLNLPQIQHRNDEIATLAHSFEGMVKSLKQRDEIQGVLNKVVSKEISEKILERSIELGGEEKIITLLFSDIRNFTHLAEGLPPHVLIEILNAYMTRMCRIIDATHGVVDKFIGDEIMTLYGAPLALDFHAMQAIKAAILMKEDLSLWNKQRKNDNLPTFEIGIGIHTGIVCIGNMGAENRLNYTAIGANVNQASRLCSVAQPMQILISEETLQSAGVKERFIVRKLGLVQLKGIEHAVQVYEVLAEQDIKIL